MGKLSENCLHDFMCLRGLNFDNITDVLAKCFFQSKFLTKKVVLRVILILCMLYNSVVVCKSIVGVVFRSVLHVLYAKKMAFVLLCSVSDDTCFANSGINKKRLSVIKPTLNQSKTL